MDKIFAVVVTYNRLPLLINTIAAIKKQTYPIDHILVINNGSTDGTKEWLDNEISIARIHQTNVGGSGGFHTGVRTAFEEGADWVWLMDDDVLPEPDCLKALLQYSTISHCINPIHFSVEGDLLEEERWFDPSTCSIIDMHNQSFNNGKQLWFRNIGSFEGMIIARDIIEKIGFPDARFFIAHDDLVYGFLANKFTNVAVVANAVIRKQPTNKSLRSIQSFEYYMNRNLWLLEEYAERELPNFIGYRRRRIKIHFLYTIYKILFIDKLPNKKLALKLLYRSYKDYKQKREGMTF